MTGAHLWGGVTWSLGCRSCSNGQKFRLRRRVLYEVNSLPSANRRFLSSKIGLAPPYLLEAVLMCLPTADTQPRLERRSFFSLGKYKYGRCDAPARGLRIWKWWTRHRIYNTLSHRLPQHSRPRVWGVDWEGIGGRSWRQRKQITAILTGQGGESSVGSSRISGMCFHLLDWVQVSTLLTPHWHSTFPSVS